MILVELFVPRDTVPHERLARAAERLGTLAEMGEGEDLGLSAASAEIFGALFNVVVHEPRTWVVGGRPTGPSDPPRCLVRVYVPAPWRKDMSATLISYTTRVLAEEVYGDDLPYREPVVQVHVVGVTEGGIGLRGRAETSEGIVELMSAPHREDQAEGRALKDPLCGVLVPLDDTTVTAELDGTLYAFCCAGCRAQFLDRRRGKVAG